MTIILGIKNFTFVNSGLLVPKQDFRWENFCSCGIYLLMFDCYFKRKIVVENLAWFNAAC